MTLKQSKIVKITIALLIISSVFYLLVSIFISSRKQAQAAEGRTIQGNCSVRAIKENGPFSDKIDILFVGISYDSDADVERDARMLLYSPNGFFSEEPFKSYESRFNIWAFNFIGAPDTTMNVQSALATLHTSIIFPQADHKVFMFPKDDFRPFAIPVLNLVYLSFPFMGVFTEDLPRIIVHELGHSIGSIKDEYVEKALGDRPGRPNCARSESQARSWWGSYENQGEGKLKVGYYVGCSYVENNIRPTENSVMNDPYCVLSAPDYDVCDYYGFGIINANKLKEVIESSTK